MMDGLALPLSMLKQAAGDKPGNGPSDAVGAILRRLSGQTIAAAGPVGPVPSSRMGIPEPVKVGPSPSSRGWIRRLLNADREALLADERAALGTILTFLEVG